MLSLYAEVLALLAKQMRVLQRRHPYVFAASAVVFFVAAVVSVVVLNKQSGNPIGTGLKELLHSQGGLAIISSAVTVSFVFISFISYLNSSVGAGEKQSRKSKPDTITWHDFTASLPKSNQASVNSYEEFRVRFLADSTLQQELTRQKAFIESLPPVILDEVAKNFEANVERASRIKQMDELFVESDIRLRAEVVAVTRRANLNLSIGATITTAALLGLIVMLFRLPVMNLGTTREAVIYFLPRVSTMIFVEVFGFFFLGLYKSSLAEVKNYQTDLTHLAQMRAAVVSAHMFDSETTRASVLNALCAVEKQKTPDGAGSIVTADSLKQALELAQQIAKSSSSASSSG